MSGIAAVLNLDGSPIAPSEIERVRNVLRPYGPDRQRILVRGNAAFVFCLHHLAREDALEHQPITLGDRLIALFDGRLDNREQLATSLGISAADLREMPDGMIAARLFDRWGERAFERVVGVFAFIAFDMSSGHLICARDQMGLRGLHYHQSGPQFAVATIPEALFALSWVPRELNLDKVGDALVQRGQNGETTYYKNVSRVLPGCIVRISSGGVKKSEFWKLDDAPSVRFKRDDEYVEAFQELLADAVRSNLRCRQPPCASMSGGLDSSSIAVTAAEFLRESGARLDTFTAVPELGFVKAAVRGRYFDETPYILQIAEMTPNIVPHFVRPAAGSIIEQVEQQIRVAAAPTGGVLNGLWVMDMLAAAKAKGHEVMLTGEMGNHTMSHDGWPLLAELAQTGRWWRLLREVKSSGYRWRYMLRHQTVAPFIPASLFKLYKHWRRQGRPPWYSFSAINPEFAARSGVVERGEREFLSFDAPPPRNGRRHRIRTLDSFSETADWFARVRARFGIDIRTPAFDRRIVEFCISIPEDQYLRNGCDRWLIRRAMKGRLPPVVLTNKNTGIQSADWFPRLTRERDRIAAEVARFGKSASVSSIIDVSKLAAILEQWPSQEPAEYGEEAFPLIWALPQALGAAYFVENALRTNVGR